MRKKQTKGLLKAAEDAKKDRNGRGGSGAHTDTLLCSDRFNIFVLQNFFSFNFYSSEELRIGLYCFIKIYRF